MQLSQQHSPSWTPYCHSLQLTAPPLTRHGSENNQEVVKSQGLDIANGRKLQFCDRQVYYFRQLRQQCTIRCQQPLDTQRKLHVRGNNEFAFYLANQTSTFSRSAVRTCETDASSKYTITSSLIVFMGPDTGTVMLSFKCRFSNWRALCRLTTGFFKGNAAESQSLALY